MKVIVLLFAAARDAASGNSEIALELPSGATAGDVVRSLSARFERLGAWEKHLRVAVNQEYVPAASALREGDVVALIPPVSGG